MLQIAAIKNHRKGCAHATELAGGLDQDCGAVQRFEAVCSGSAVENESDETRRLLIH